VISLLGLALSALTSLFGSNSDLAADTRAQLRAEAAHRQNMAALARVLRGVDIQSLTGFDPKGIATQPAFGRVTGASLDELTYVGDERLAWMPATIGVDGVTKPGPCTSCATAGAFSWPTACPPAASTCARKARTW